MRWRDALRLAAAGVTRRFGRAALTVLAVALAAALLTALLTISGTARNRVLSQLSKGGPLAAIKVEAAEPNLSQLNSDNPTPGAPRPIDQAALVRISVLPGVQSVVAVVSTPELVIPPRPPIRPNSLSTPAPGTTGSSSSQELAVPLYPRPFVDEVIGIDMPRIADLPITVVAGRLPAPGAGAEVAVTEGYLERLHLSSAQASAVLGTQLELGAPRVFPSLGPETLRGRWTKAEIVGVVAQQVGSGQVIASIGSVQAAQEFSAAGGDPGGRLHLSKSPYAALFVVANGLDRIGSVRNEITQVGFSNSAPENLIASVFRYLHVVEIVLTGIGAIALVIAALGIASAMLAAVRERRREIGVLKAIGARDRDVLRVFLIEAAVLGFLGGLGGTLVGWIVARGLGAVVNGYLTQQALNGVRIGFALPIVLGGVVGSTVLALVAGTLPALRAARLPANDAVLAA